MKKKPVGIILAIAIFVGLPASAFSVDSALDPFVHNLVSAMPKDRNYMISPFSLKMVLAMAANGAGGDTRKEILDALGIADLGRYNSHARAFIESSNKNRAVEFNMANSIWNNTDRFADLDLEFSDEFEEIVADYFGGTARNINNANGAKTINDWIALQTRDRIKNGISDDVIRGSLSFLVNAIYFKGDWLVPFRVGATKDGIFTDRNGQKNTTAFMTHTDDYSYFTDDHVQMLAKPYMDRNIQMYFVLPKSGEAAREEYIKPYIFGDALDRMTSTEIRFMLPKFKTEYLHDNLLNIMRGMGVQAAFNDAKADFLSMFSKKPPLNVYIDSIIQKTFIEVDEKGTEAAAATSIVEIAHSSMGPPIFFICNRPFFYFIRNDATGEILFMGEYAFVE